MKNKYSSFYFLHIPKTGGTYLKNTVVYPLFEIFKKNNISFINNEDSHSGWQDIDNNYVISNFRDPVKRTISHYDYFKQVNKNRSFIKKYDNFIDWVKKYENFISNYQSKYFMYTQKNLNVQIFSPTVFYGADPDFLKIDLNKKETLDRVKSVNILLRDTQLNNDTCNNVIKKILNDFNIDDVLLVNNKIDQDHNVSKNSLEIYKTLTKKEIEYLYNLNNIDSEIYFANYLYFNNTVAL